MTSIPLFRRANSVRRGHIGLHLRPASRVGRTLQTEHGNTSPCLGINASVDARRLALAGEFDVSGVDAFAGSAAAVMARRQGDVVVDLSHLQFIDAAGLAALVLLRHDVTRSGHRLWLTGPGRRVRRVFALGDLSWLLAGPAPTESAEVLSMANTGSVGTR